MTGRALRRVIVLVLCGGADRPHPDLGGLTPLEAAPTPHLDHLASRGTSGLVDVIGSGIPPESDSGAMALLGYDPMAHYLGRGPLEGLGMGFLTPGDCAVAFRVNFASWNRANGQLDRRTSRDLTDTELAQLVAEVRAEVRLDDLGGTTFQLAGFGRHRGILALRRPGAALDGRVSNTDPGFASRGPFGVPVDDPAPTPLPCRPLTSSPGAQAAAIAVNAFVERSSTVLDASAVNSVRRRAGRKPANLILVRDGGSNVPELASFQERTGGSLSMYGQVPAERGIAGLIGARFTHSAPAPGHHLTSYYRDLAASVTADSADVRFVHIKGPDEPGHDGRPIDKIEAIRVLDEALLGALTDALTPADTLVVTCDHATPWSVGLHTADPVPLVVAGPGLPVDDVTRFGERAAAAGGLAVTRASEFLDWLAARRTTEFAGSGRHEDR
ncbi:MAG: CMP-5'-phosphonoformate--3-phosphoglycerate phosphonoformyl transferase [Nocardioides sp.]